MFFGFVYFALLDAKFWTVLTVEQYYILQYFIYIILTIGYAEYFFLCKDCPRLPLVLFFVWYCIFLID